MEQIVERGTATFAQVDGIHHRRQDRHGGEARQRPLLETDYFASFVGFFPSRNPVATIIVVIDSPHAHGYYGGPIAGPVFQRIAEATLRHFGVVADAERAAAGARCAARDEPEIQPARSAREASIVPVGAHGVAQRPAGFSRAQRARSAEVLTQARS